MDLSDQEDEYNSICKYDEKPRQEKGRKASGVTVEKATPIGGPIGRRSASTESEYSR